MTYDIDREPEHLSVDHESVTLHPLEERVWSAQVQALTETPTEQSQPPPVTQTVLPGITGVPAKSAARPVRRWHVLTVVLLAVALVGTAVFAGLAYRSAREWQDTAVATESARQVLEGQRNALDSQLTTTKAQLVTVNKQLSTARQDLVDANTRISTLASEKANLADEKAYLTQIATAAAAVADELDTCVVGLATVMGDLEYYAYYGSWYLESVVDYCVTARQLNQSLQELLP